MITYRSGPEWDTRFGQKRQHPEESPSFCPDFAIEYYLDKKVRFKGVKVRFKGVKIRSKGVKVRFKGIKVRFKVRFKGIKVRFKGVKVRFKGVKVRFKGKCSSMYKVCTLLLHVPGGEVR